MQSQQKPEVEPSRLFKHDTASKRTIDL